VGRRLDRDRHLGGQTGHEPDELDARVRRERRAAPRPAALVDDRDRAYFGGPQQGRDQFGYIEPNKLAVFGRSYAAEPDELVEQLKEDTAIDAADTLLLTVPNQLGVDYNAHAIESILRYVAPGLGWR
jgi:alkanesulfonate monooxygenase SsuD/methylene tetrahydromethanopterin reductase-like flavin-dependent oxidoreductase (luciferase family)